MLTAAGLEAALVLPSGALLCHAFPRVDSVSLDRRFPSLVCGFPPFFSGGLVVGRGSGVGCDVKGGIVFDDSGFGGCGGSTFVGATCCERRPGASLQLIRVPDGSGGTEAQRDGDLKSQEEEEEVMML